MKDLQAVDVKFRLGMLKMCFRWLLEIAAISKAEFRSVTLNNGRYPTNRGKST